jgi:hypothetical protein
MSPLQINKLVAHSSHLLTTFIQLRERYALLHPMLFDERVAKQYGSWKQARGYAILKASLFLSCCQDIAKLTTDNFDKTPSISKLMGALQDPIVRSQLRKKYCDGRSVYAHEKDPELEEVYKLMALQDDERNRAEFDGKYAHAAKLWEEFVQSPVLKSFRHIRDKVTAHTELQLVDGEYVPVDISKLGIKWGNLQTTIATMQQLVEMLGQLIRDAGFAWQSLDEMLAKAGNDFWQDMRDREDRPDRSKVR